MTTAERRLPRALMPFARRQYRLLLSGLVLAMFADGVWTIAVVWQVIELGGGPAQVSLATGASAVGMLVSTLAGGVLADRVSQRVIMIGLETVKMIVFGLIGLASILGVLSLWHVVAAAILGGVTIGMYYPAYSALLPSIVEPSELQAANGIEGFLRPVVFQAVGPMIAGAVIAAAAPGPAVVLAAAGSIVSALFYVRMDPVALRRSDSDGGEPLRGNPIRTAVTDVAEGFAYLWRTPWLWATLFFACVLVLATMGPIEVLVPFALQERVHGGASDHALVLAGFGAGAASASLVFASIRMPRRYLTVMFSIWGFSSVPLVLMGLADATWMFVLAGFAMGVLFDGPMVLWGTLLQRRVPPAILGRVASLDFFVSIALMPVSMAIAAPLSHYLGLTTTFILAGLLPVPVALAFYLAARLWRDEVAHPITDVVTVAADPVPPVVERPLGLFSSTNDS
ncbi:MFS transporter [Gordonia sp. ABSL49_1]|uniref:MFS transporter n=1 Tax=Gordonia sp. ABSL49_1 TaxID=2920941 RepID=UPI001F0E0E71|nr:MFS transporter [Gordonia sp. ABSL49_1]MCH5641064.1 MFS transporter [Gordonia sp. ABSL49_1]